jgi:hypothetical protein
MKSGWADAAVSSWTELIAVLHSRKFVPRRREEGNHLRSPYVFRGMDVDSWKLHTSLQRLAGNPAQVSTVVEKSLLRSFRKYASAGSFDRQSDWYVMAVGQHNGLPTRCLDWSTSPLVAAHFACGDRSWKDENGVIWCIHAGLLRQITVQAVKSLQGISWVYDTRLLEQSFQDLDALDHNSCDPFMLLWEPPSLDLRIAGQSGLLSIMNGGARDYEDFLRMHCQRYPDLVQRIVIKKRAKSEIRDMLDQNNISERSLFPGLPGLCDWLKRYYGHAW